MLDEIGNPTPENPGPATVAVLGVGTVGSALAKRLLGAGMTVVV
jgi:lactate dehydrogenase-like 2-hydroxyacid dehydrogenase